MQKSFNLHTIFAMVNGEGEVGEEVKCGTCARRGCDIQCRCEAGVGWLWHPRALGANEQSWASFLFISPTPLSETEKVTRGVSLSLSICCRFVCACVCVLLLCVRTQRQWNGRTVPMRNATCWPRQSCSRIKGLSENVCICVCLCVCVGALPIRCL